MAVDASDFLKRSNKLSSGMGKIQDQAVKEIADEALRLSVKEVPVDENTLSNSGVSEPRGEAKYEVGFHTTYAARLHEHPEYNFQHGKKGKYLEDPIKRNLRVFQKYYNDELEKGIRAILK